MNGQTQQKKMVVWVLIRISPNLYIVQEELTYPIIDILVLPHLQFGISQFLYVSLSSLETFIYLYYSISAMHKLVDFLIGTQSLVL